jgi:CheY-like chemotaxis protein
MNMPTHTVLIVEDEADLREMLREALELHGYEVVAVEDGQAALEAAERIDRICLVLLDLLMPGMNGWDFFAALRTRPDLDTVPVIVHTSTPDTAPPGVTRVLQKPLQLKRLLSTVAEFCPPSP